MLDNENFENEQKLYDDYGNEMKITEPQNTNYKKEKKKRGGGFKIVLLALVFSILGGIIGSTITMRNMPAMEMPAQNNNLVEINTNDSINTVSAVATKTLDSVVGISTKSTIESFFFGKQEAKGTGSGVIVDERGYILTNNHVIASIENDYSAFSGKQKQYADEIAVVFNDGSQTPAEIIWSDASLDLAILKVQTEKRLPAAKLGDSSELKIGEVAIAIGNPLAIEFHGTVTAGYISGLDRTVTTQEGIMENLIQTDASINPGNSGGPLLNSKGEVIGINTLKVSSAEGLGFSIPINTAKPIIKQVIDDGEFKMVQLGIQGTDLTKYEQMLQVETSLDHGVIIIEVQKNSAAERAGLKNYDVILKIDDKDIIDFNALKKKLYEYKPKDTVKIEYSRDGKLYTTDLTF